MPSLTRAATRAKERLEALNTDRDSRRDTKASTPHGPVQDDHSTGAHSGLGGPMALARNPPTQALDAATQALQQELTDPHTDVQAPQEDNALLINCHMSTGKTPAYPVSRKARGFLLLTCEYKCH